MQKKKNKQKKNKRTYTAEERRIVLTKRTSEFCLSYQTSVFVGTL